jgi:hypothetical protein
MYRMLLVASVVLTSIGVAPATSQDKPNFSGTWQVDKTRSTMQITPAKNISPDAPTPPPPPPIDRIPPDTIKHNEPLISIQSGPPTNVLELSSDGVEKTRSFQNNDLLQKSKTRWDGNKLVTTWTTEIDGRKLSEGTDVRWLEGPTTLLQDRKIVSSTTETVIHLVWTRAK